jgi:energy-coupling factor transporter ATP-binding protein EcfA2
MKDWGEVSDIFEKISANAFNKILENESEAQTRFDVIDRIIREILQWEHGQISVEPHSKGANDSGFIDYILTAGNFKIIVEAKKIGTTFPSPTKRKKLKLTGTILGKGEISKAIKQAETYALDEDADLVMVTNGTCWCFYPLEKGKGKDLIFATLLFPFEDNTDAEHLYNYFAVGNVERNSLDTLTTNNPIEINNRLNTIVDNSDYRVGRNNIADYVMPALDKATLSEEMFTDLDVLERCYVSTDARTKFDKTLNMHLAQYKPTFVKPVKSLSRNKRNDELSKEIEKVSLNASSSPVTLVIGSVGSGKSTYLKHFELIRGRELLKSQKAHWIYIDLEKMGKNGNPRTFIYESLKEFLIDEHPENPIDYGNVIKPAYKREFENLARGPYAIIAKDKAKFDAKKAEIIDKDYLQVEPYVNKLFKYLATVRLCIIVIDNVDLYEDDELETKVFSEAISISKNINCHILVSIRDTTFIKHKNDSIFNAYELNKLWINPPSFSEVLSRRLNYSKLILKNEKADIEMSNGAILKVDDLSLFFSIVQKSLLSEENGQLLGYLSDRNPRKGISLVRNFLSSGHIQADKAFNNYINGEASFIFPYHEVFKGSILGAWKYFKEERADAINLYDSKIGNNKLQLLRLHVLKFMHMKSSFGESEVHLTEIIDVISQIGVSKDLIVSILNYLEKNSLIHSNNQDLSLNPSFNLTLSGGYYITILAKKIVYVESVLYDTNIYDIEVWERLKVLTLEIENNHYTMVQRLELRRERAKIFMIYLESIEKNSLSTTKLLELSIIDNFKNYLLKEFTSVILKVNRRVSAL